jgi:ribosomal protein S1
MTNLKPGTKLSLPIRSVHSFGFFVDVGNGLEGFVHKTQISRNLNMRNTKRLTQRDTVDLWVIDVNHDTGRAALTMIDPAAPMMEELRQGQKLTGVVVNIVDELGAFVDIGVQQEGLVHVSEMRKTRVSRASDVVREGEEVTVWVKSVDVGRHRISLSMLPPPSRTVRDLRPGMVLDGTVVGFHENDRGVHDGAFVDVDANEQGWLHISEISQDYLRSVSDVLSLRQRVRVRVLRVDPAEGRFSLTMKNV